MIFNQIVNNDLMLYCVIEKKKKKIKVARFKVPTAKGHNVAKTRWARGAEYNIVNSVSTVIFRVCPDGSLLHDSSSLRSRRAFKGDRFVAEEIDRVHCTQLIIVETACRIYFSTITRVMLYLLLTRRKTCIHRIDLIYF